jgi:hypothetical protein
MSGQKPWSKMTQAEKIEELHDALTKLGRAHDSVALMVSQTATALKEVGRAVENLQKRLDQAKIPPT